MARREASGRRRPRPGPSAIARFLTFAVGDMIAAAHVVMIAGMLLYDPENQVIPPIHTMSTALPLQLMLLSYFAYQAGRLVARRPLPASGTTLAHPAPPVPGAAVSWLACVCAGIVVIVQIVNLRNKGSLADLAFAKASSGEEFGPLNRVTYTMLPYLAGFLYYTSLFHKRLRWIAFPVAAMCLVGLALTLFKVNVVLFLVLLVYLSLIARGETTVSLGALFRSPRVAMAVVVVAVAMYYASEGEGLWMSVSVVLARAVVFSWEGFAYIVETPARPDLAEQLSVFMGARAAPPPDVLLAKEMLNLDPPPIGIVVTLPGFLYRNFAAWGVGLGALVLGWCAQRAVERATRDVSTALVVLSLSLYFALVEVFLVGNLFNTLRGGILTLLATYAVVLGLEKARAASHLWARPSVNACTTPSFTRSNWSDKR